MSLSVLLLACAFICFMLAAAGVPSRINLTALGLMLWVLTILLGAIHV